MWELYEVLKSGISSHPKAYMMDEIIFIIHNITAHNFEKSLFIMTGEKFNNPLEAAIAFTKGLKQNKFFAFVELVENINGRSK